MTNKQRIAALDARIAALEIWVATLEARTPSVSPITVETLCPGCLDTRIKETIRRNGSRLIAESVRGAGN